MADVFLSYSRRDRPFVEYLRSVLEAARRSVWVDLRDIPPSAAWRDEVRDALVACDAVICVLSPDYAASPVCREEVEYAQANHKRLIPIVCRDVGGQDVLPVLSALNWIFFRREDPPDDAMRRLLSALDTDLPYVRSGTRLLVRAKDWHSHAHNASFTLRGKDLLEAEQWLAISGSRQPPPTQEQTEYILASRRARTRRQSTVIGALTVGIIITLVLSIISTTLYKITNDQNAILGSHDTAGSATDGLFNGRLDQGLLLAVAASRQHDDFDTRNALLNGLEANAYLDAVLIGKNPSGAVSNVNYADVAYSNDGKTLLVADIRNEIVTLWDAASHKPRLRMTIPSQPPVVPSRQTDDLDGAALSPDGSTVATKNYYSGIRLWSAANGSLITTISDRLTSDITATNASIKFSPNGRLLAWSECADPVCDSEQVIVWDISTRKVLHTLPLTGPLQLGLSVTLAWSADSSLLAAGLSNTFNTFGQGLFGSVAIFAPATGALLESFQLGGGSPNSQPQKIRTLAFSPSSSLLAIGGVSDSTGSTGSTGQVQFWSVTQQQFVGRALSESDGDIYAEAFSPDGQYLVTGMGSSSFGVRVWNISDRVPATPALRAHTDFINSVAFSPDGQHFVSSGYDGQVLMWRLAPSSSLSHVLGSDFTGYSQVAFSPDGALLAVGSTSMVTLWDVKSGAKRKTLTIPAADRKNAADEVSSLAFSPDGKTLAVGDALAQILLWSVASGQPIGQPLRGHKITLPGTIYNFVSDLTFSPDGSLLASSAVDGSTILWNVASQSQIHTFPGTFPRLRQAAFSPDGHYLAVTGVNQDIIIWDLHEQTLAETLKSRGVLVRGLSFYPHLTATLAALDLNGNITTWSVASGTTIGQPMSDGKVGDTLFTPHLVFNAAGTLLVSSHDESLTIWDVSQLGHGVKYVRTIIPDNTLWNATLSPDGRYLADSTPTTVDVRYATLAGWRASACRIANRNLSRSEWQQLIPNSPYQTVC